MSKFRPDDIDVCGRRPTRPGVPAVRIAERHVKSGNLFVLQDIADDLMYGQIGPDRELSHAITIFVAMRIFPETPFRVPGSRTSPIAAGFRVLSRVSGVSLRSPNLAHR